MKERKKKLKKGTIKVKFANGFGNNLFRYSFCRLLAEYHNLNYSHPAIPELNIKEEKYKFNKDMGILFFKANSNLEAKKFDTDYHKYFSSEWSNYNFDFYKFVFYFEDYTLYKPNRDRICSWFPKIEKKNYEDLVLHLRLENRLIQETHYKNRVDPSVYKKVMKSNFNFKKLYIVTDSDRWDYANEKYIRILHNRYRGEGTPYVSINKSIEYMNSFVDNFKEFDPIIVHNDKLINDFNFIRSFDQIMFKNSTFSWWAAFLGNATKVGVYKPWKPNKGERNKNLGRTDIKGWFGWE